MFAQLAKLLKQGDTVSVVLALENETQLRVNVFPKLAAASDEDDDEETKEPRQALNQPLSIVATAAELDAGFAETLEKFTASTNTLRHTLEEVEAAHKTAAAAAKKPAPAKSKIKPGRPDKAAPVVKPTAPPIALPEPPAAEAVKEADEEAASTEPKTEDII